MVADRKTTPGQMTRDEKMERLTQRVLKEVFRVCGLAGS
jgi:hypothetical protein